ncbi:nuclear transport factor 2 family protein [Hymenobacter sp. BT491]|uniref:nuclear transport factor 2 family protein n=1 Tax=Hymenobacter sp. BT491 TaxID=2766779 RepID=UPI0016539C73|nr:nuclear transport factor 2 family protein [Hymenobacter sp. BT491]MBC6991922.1 nuclear transport factor 2 family protein [Hymenobacter sp. BT491]
MDKHLDVLNTYYRLVEAFNSDPTAYREVLHPEVEQIEYPNLIHKTIQHRSFDDILDNLRAGRELLRDPEFIVHSTHVVADGTIIVEGRWQGTVTTDIHGWVRGQIMSSELCLVFEFKDGKIFRQRRYPCYNQV